MKNPKDIFDLFKDNEHKLNQPPSPRAWDRLEARLDNRQEQLGSRRAPNLLRNWISMAAVLLVLVTCISALSILFRSQSAKTAMSERSANIPFTVEEIGIYSDQNSLVYNIGTYQKQLNRLNTNPILEGDPSKELRVQEAVFVAMKNRNRNSNKDKKSDNRKQLAMESSNGSTARQSPAANAQARMSDDLVMTYNEDSGLQQVIDKEQVSMAMDEVSAAATYDSVSEEEIATLGASNFSLEQFDWLIGQWEASVSNNSTTGPASAKKNIARTNDVLASAAKEDNAKPLRSIEEWTRSDANTLRGTGYLMINGEQTFAEEMRIEQHGGDLFYVLQLQAQHMERRYLLKSYTAEEVVFENLTLSFPNQVVLRPDPSGNQLTIILQNSSPMQIDEAMRAYFEQRNEISSEQIRRLMKRVE